MFSNFQVISGLYGPKMILKGQWDNSLYSTMKKNGIKELYLNYVLGWSGDNLNFLEGLDYLLSFDILDWKIMDISPIHYLKNLKAISINTYCKSEIDFRVFNCLEDCALEWRPKASSISNCITMKKLFISMFNEDSFIYLKDLVNLDTLRVKGGTPVSTEHLSGLKNLDFLGLYALKRLFSINGIRGLCNLRRLEIEKCPKIQEYKAIGRLTNLEALFLNDLRTIPSIDFIRYLEKLKVFNFVESTNIADGDLTPLVNSRNLRSVAFQNRRHYSVKREILERYIRVH